MGFLKEILAFLHELHPVVDQVFDLLQTRLGKLILTIALLFVTTSINRLMKWKLLVRDNELEDSSHIRARWVRSRNWAWVITFILIIMLWSSQISGFLLSVAAVVGAMLIVSKELILCLWGALMISLNKTLQIGALVEIGKFQGQLVNTGFLSFDLAEIGPSKKQTGRLLQIPNSIFFTEPVKNLSTYGAYGIHLIDFYFDVRVELQKVESLALKITHETGKQWFDKAERNFAAFEQASFMDMPKAQPEVFWSSQNDKTLRMTLRFACPLNKRGQIEKTIVKKFWIEYQTLGMPEAQDSEPKNSQQDGTTTDTHGDRTE